MKEKWKTFFSKKSDLLIVYHRLISWEGTMKKVLLSAALLLVTATATSAATISYTDSIARTETDWSDTLSITKFNSTLGTLTGITYTFSGGLWGEATIVAKAGKTATWTNSGVEASISLMSTFLTAAITVSPIVAESGSTTGSYTLSGYDDDSATGSLFTYSAYFIGSGSVDFGVSAEAFTYGKFSNATITTGGDAAATLTVTYTYDAPPPSVPEPATLLLFGTGLTCLAGIVRRKTSR